MRKIGTPAALLITAALAALLIYYVFAGGSSRQTASGSGPRCTSQQALALVKDEIFRRATAVRRSDDPGLGQVAQHSVLRAASRIVRGRDERSGAVTCTGSLALDMPPGITVVDGRRSLTADLRYALRTGPDGKTLLHMLGNTDPIVVPLATLAPAESSGAPLPAPADMNMSGAEDAELPIAAEAPSEPAPPAPQSAAAEQTRPEPAPPTAKPAPKRERPTVEAETRPQAAPKRETPPARAVSAARPSFNCRYARTRGEIAVCSDPGLASLDRQMAAQFNGAMAAATPAQRRLLQRTRSRFLGYRDSCGSSNCMANTYQSRMREISDIMADRWSP